MLPSRIAEITSGSTTAGPMPFVFSRVMGPSVGAAQRMLKKLRSEGRPVQSIHPCYDGHPGQWHVTRRRSRRS